MIRRPPRSPPFPYTTLFRSLRNQPIPQLNFNEQTATAVFGGFQDKQFGNTLIVRPSINKDNYITLSVKPEISNKVQEDRKSTRLNSSHLVISYAVFCLKKKK